MSSVYKIKNGEGVELPGYNVSAPYLSKEELKLKVDAPTQFTFVGVPIRVLTKNTNIGPSTLTITTNLGPSTLTITGLSERWADPAVPKLLVEDVVVPAYPDDAKPDPIKERLFPDDAIHRAARDVISGAPSLKPNARKAVREALDRADAPPIGRKASDEAVGRAFRYVR